MTRRVSKPAAALLALSLFLATPSAFAASVRRGSDPDFGTRIVRFLKHFANKFGISTNEDITMPCPPIP